jgi:hypothetical protein
MLLTQTLDKLDALGLFGMALALREQLEGSQYASLSFEERFGLLVDREAEARDSRRLALRLKAAKLRQEATVEDIDFRAPRGRPSSRARWRMRPSGVATPRCTSARRACWRNWRLAVATGGTCADWDSWPGLGCSSSMTSS